MAPSLRASILKQIEIIFIETEHLANKLLFECKKWIPSLKVGELGVGEKWYDS